MTAMGLNAVYKMLHHPLTDFITKKVVIHEDVPHGFSFQKLNRLKLKPQIYSEVEKYTEL